MADDPAAGVRFDMTVRWGDMDALGHVNNTVYFRFCESARIAYFEAIGLEELADKPTDGPGLVQASLNFRRQVKYPATLEIAGRCTRIGGKSFHLTYTIRDKADGAVVADGDSVCVWVDYELSKAKPLPAALIDAIVRLENNPALRPGANPGETS